MLTLSKREWPWLLGWSAAIILISSLPYLYGWWLSTPQMQFSGFFIGVEDANSYLAKMRQGAGGGWLFHLPYTPEAHPGVYLYTFHLLLGKISAATGLSPTLTYHVARLGLGILLLVLVYQFIAAFAADLKIRRTAFLLVGWGSGLGWLVIATGWVNQIGLPLDIYLPEGFNFLILLHLPHLLLAETLLLAGFLCLWRAWETDHRRWVWAILAGGAFFVVVGVAAFYLIVMIAVVGTTMLLRFWFARRWAWGEVGLALAALSITLPVSLYNFWVFATIPAYQLLSQQLIMRSPAPIHYLLAYGVLALLALPGLKKAWPQGRHFALLIAWVVVVPILIYLPFNLQRRLVMGVQLPLSILAALGLSYLCGASLRRWRWSNTGLILLVSLTNIFLVIGGLLNISAQQAPIFHPASQLAAMRWLDQAANDEVILAVYATGNVLPAYANVRAFVGHGPETLYSDEKRAQAQQFFTTATTDAWRIALLRDYGVRYIYYGPAEKAAGGFAPDRASYLEEIYQNGEIQIFEVNSARLESD